MKPNPGERLVRDEIFIRVRAARTEHALICFLVAGLVGVAYTALNGSFGLAFRRVTATLAAVVGG